MILHLDTKKGSITVSTLVKDPKRLRVMVDEGDILNATAAWVDLTASEAMRLVDALNRVSAVLTPKEGVDHD